MTQLELEAIIRHNQMLYYNGQEAISDAEFDKLWEILETEYPNSELLKVVGEDSVDVNKKVYHKILMGSQNKVSSLQDLNKWLKNVTFPILVQPKWDGNSIEVQYQDGLLTYAVTRGNGKEGEDVTRAIILNGKVPTKFDFPFTGALRGEIILKRSVFEEKYSNFKNPRNFTAGALKNETFTEYSDFDIYFYDIYNENLIYETETEKLMYMRNMGVNVSRNWLALSVEEINKLYKEYHPYYFEVNIDGLVLKQNVIDPNDAYEMRPKKQIALKWKNDVEETTFLGVEWSRTGTTYTPVAVLDPVDIDGTTVKRASLANLDGINNLGLHVGDIVGVVKRGEIIPKIECVVEHTGKEEVAVIEYCECCGSRLIITPTRVYCANPNCRGVFEHRLAKWLNVIDVKEFGPALQSFCIDNGIDSIKALYTQSNIDNIINTYGSINANKAFKNLLNKKVDLTKAIAGFDIEGIGVEIVKSIIDAGYDTVESINNLKEEDLIAINGWSNIRANQFMTGWDCIKDEVADLIEMGVVKDLQTAVTIIDSDIAGMKFCITGKLNLCTRNEMEAKLTSRGAILDKSVGKSTDYLVTNDTTSGSSKLKNAEKFGTKIINEEDLLKML